MNKRKIQLLKRLVEEENYLTIGKLAEDFHCSSRTVRNDLDELSERLQKNGFYSIERRSGVGVQLEINSQQMKEFTKFIRGLEQSSDEAGIRERQWSLLYRLLMSKTPLLMSDLAVMHYVSVTSIRKDIEQLEEICKDYGLEIVSVQHQGTTIIGEEKQKRALLSYTVKRMNEFGLKEKAIMQFFDQSEVKIVKDALKKLEKKVPIYLTEEARESIQVHVLFTLKRVYLNQPIVLSEEERNRIRGSRFYEWATELAWDIQEKVNVTFPINEVSYLALHLRSARMDLDSAKDEIPKWVESMVEYLIKEVSDLMEVSFENDQVLRENVVLHMRTTSSRLESGFVIANPLLEQIKQEYLYLFYFIKNVVDTLKETIPYDIPEEEIGYLTVHFQAAIERQSSKKEEDIKVGVVCHYGVGVSAFIQAKIESEFKEIKKTVLLSESQVTNSLKNKGFSFILTTVPLEINSIPVLKISALLNETEMNRISQLMKGSNSEKNKYTPWTLADYSQPFLIHLQKDFSSMEDVLQFMIRELIKREYVYKRYLHSTLEREGHSPTTIGKGIALPHGNPNFVKQSTISCLTLKTPVNWHGRKVSIIFLIALKKETLKKEESKGFFKFVNQVMGDDLELNQLKKENNVLEFLEKVKIKE